VDDDKIVMHTVQDQLSRETIASWLSPRGGSLAKVRIERFGIIVADQSMPEISGIEFLRICRETQPLSSRIIITGMASVPGD